MAKRDAFLAQVLSGTADASVAFDRLCGLLRRLGFTERIRCSHHIFSKTGVEEIEPAARWPEQSRIRSSKCAP